MFPLSRPVFFVWRRETRVLACYERFEAELVVVAVRPRLSRRSVGGRRLRHGLPPHDTRTQRTARNEGGQPNPDSRTKDASGPRSVAEPLTSAAQYQAIRRNESPYQRFARP